LLLLTTSLVCFMLVCCVGLKLGTAYEMTVVAINDHGENELKMKSVKAVTSGNLAYCCHQYLKSGGLKK